MANSGVQESEWGDSRIARATGSWTKKERVIPTDEIIKMGQGIENGRETGEGHRPQA
jgi:hypothetical protein